MKSEAINQYYICFAEGFAIYHCTEEDESGSMRITLDRFTRDIRKATPNVDKGKAFGVANFIARYGLSRSQHFCLVQPSLV